MGLSVVVAILINVALITLLERKLLSIMQLRIGPNKVGAWGLLQPAADAVKLFMKEVSWTSSGNKWTFLAAPGLALVLALGLSLFLPWPKSSTNWELGIMGILLILSLNVYPVLISGWASNSKYAMIGGLRGVAQTISYEISLAFIIFALAIWESATSLSALMTSGVSGALILPSLAVLWGVSCLAELNRTPFDFAEGESELVSGFNIEYGAVKFAVLFMAEYAVISVLSLMTAFLVFQSASGVWGLIFMSGVIWSRATYPRYRYDALMQMAWKTFLPWSLVLLQVSALMIMGANIF